MNQDTTLPPLPEPKASGLGDEYESFDSKGQPMGKAYANIDYFTTEQLHAYARAAIATQAQQPDSRLDDFDQPIVYDTGEIDLIAHALTGDEGEDDGVTVLNGLVKYLGIVHPGKTMTQVLIETEDARAAVKESLTSQQAQEVPTTWSRYVAGMIACYLKWPDDDERVEAVAGIIERRRWSDRQSDKLAISPLEEQQLFDDWCPYKGNPDPRVVWAAAIDAANGMLAGIDTKGGDKP